MGSLAKVNPRHQVTIPSAVRRRLRIRAGDTIQFEVVGEEEAILRAQPVSRTDHYAGLCKDIWKDVDIDESIRKERQAWDKAPLS